jgi:hypothetical protein
VGYDRVMHHSLPDSKGKKDAFNYVNPLDLSKRYAPLCSSYLFRNADALMYFFGFQVCLTWWCWVFHVEIAVGC